MQRAEGWGINSFEEEKRLRSEFSISRTPPHEGGSKKGEMGSEHCAGGSREQRGVRQRKGWNLSLESEANKLLMLGERHSQSYVSVSQSLDKVKGWKKSCKSEKKGGGKSPDGPWQAGKAAGSHWEKD